MARVSRSRSAGTRSRRAASRWWRGNRTARSCTRADSCSSTPRRSGNTWRRRTSGRSPRWRPRAADRVRAVGQSDDEGIDGDKRPPYACFIWPTTDWTVPGAARTRPWASSKLCTPHYGSPAPSVICPSCTATTSDNDRAAATLASRHEDLPRSRARVSRAHARPVTDVGGRYRRFTALSPNLPATRTSVHTGGTR